MTGKRGNSGGFTGIFAPFFPEEAAETGAREDKTQILRKNSEKQLAIYICLWYYISAFRTAPDFRSVPARVGRGEEGVGGKNQKSKE